MYPVVELFGEKIFLYPLFMGFAWGAGVNLVFYYAKTVYQGIGSLKFLLLLQFLSAWVGAKTLFLITFEGDSSIVENSNFWLGGGFVFYGGFLCALLITCIFIFKKRITIEQSNIFVPALALGHGIGRLGCLFAGCCFGKTCELPWGIHLHGSFRHPVQIYEALALFTFFLVFHFRLLKTPKIILWPYYILSYSAIRFSLEFFRGDKIRGVYYEGLSTSQIISIFFIIISIGYLLLPRFKKH